MRSLFTIVLLILLVPVVLLANAATWATRTVLDEAVFASAVGRALDTPALEEVVATRATETAIRALDSAPDRLEVVSRVVLGLSESPSRGEIEAALHARILDALTAPEVEAARDDAVAAVHGFLVGGGAGGGGLVGVEGSEVVLDLGPLVEAAAAAVDDRLPRAGLDDISEAEARIVLGDATVLRTANRAVTTMRGLQLAIPLLVLAIVLLVAVFARRRTRALGVAGLAIMTAGLASLAIAWLGAGIVGRMPEDPLVGEVTREVYAAFLSPLVLQSLVIAAGGALLALGSWLALRRRATASVA